MRGVVAVVVWLLCGILTTCRWRQVGTIHDKSTTQYNVTQAWFTNYLDHFDHLNHATYQQRYWYTLDLWDPTSGPILLMLGGEGPDSFPGDRSLMLSLGREFKAAVVALEHRFYGASLPSGNWSVENLKFLSHDQALADSAYFARFFKAKLEELAMVKLKLFIFGRSYSGALSAWMRYKYPYLVDGAISSSGVVNAILDFHEFDAQVRASVLKSGPQCEAVIQELLRDVKVQWEASPARVRRWYNAPFMEWDDFMFYISDLFVIPVQYGHRAEFCALLEALPQGPERHPKLGQLGTQYGVTPNGYSFAYIRMVQPDVENNFRQWTYQYCSSLGYFNTPGKVSPLRYPEMNLTYWRRYCAKAFDLPLFPDTEHTNGLYGQVRIAELVSKVIFTNGAEDPWQWATVRE